MSYLYSVAIEKNGQIIRHSKNLRGIVDYARISKPLRVELTPINKSNGRLRVIFADGASTSAHFASYHIMIDWVRNRRSWDKKNVFIYGDDIGYLTKPGLIGGAK